MHLVRLLLLLYPRGFRRRRGSDLCAFIHADLLRARADGALAFGAALARTTLDLLVNLPLAWRDATRPTMDTRTLVSLESLSLDVRLAFRRLLRTPGFTAVTVLTLGLAIGAATSVFSLIDQVLLRPLPYSHADRLIALWESTNGRDISVSWPNFEDWRARLTSFDGLAIYGGRSITLTGAGGPVRVRRLAVTADLFSTVGVEPELGRFLGKDADGVDAAREVVLTHALWTERFGADPNVLGRMLQLDGESYEIVGVAPAGFRFPDGISLAPSDLFTPIGLALGPTVRDERREHAGLYAIGRLRPGVQLAGLRGELAALSAALEAQYPEADEGYRIMSAPVMEAIVGDTGRTLLMAACAVALVLVVAAANVSGLFLARAWTRASETALQRALGAGAGRLTRQVMLESVLVCGASGVLGLGMGVLAISAASPMLSDLPRPVHSTLDLRVIGFSTAAALALALCVGLLPGLRTDPGDAGARGGSRVVGGLRDGRLRDGLVAAEVALAALLLVGAGLLVRSFATVRMLDGGIRSDHVLTFSVGLPEATYDDEARRSFFTRFGQEMSALPGVDDAGAVSVLPFSGSGSQSDFGPVGSGRDGALPTDVEVVLPGYFETMGIELRKGRLLDGRDQPDGPVVAVVDERFARAEFGDEDPIGRQVEGWGFPTVEIVGVVTDVAHYGVLQAGRQTLYVPYAQRPYTSMNVVVRTTGDPLALVPAIRERLDAIDPSIPIDAPTAMEERVATTLQGPRIAAQLGSIMAALGALLSIAGVHALVEWAVSRRSREIGVRIALGGKPAEVLARLLLRVLRPALLGLLAGLAASIAVTSAMRPWVRGISALDPVSYAVTGLGMLAVIVIAGWIPALRLTRIDPAQSLRAE